MASVGITQKKIELQKFIDSKTFAHESSEHLGHNEEFHLGEDQALQRAITVKEKAKVLLHRSKFLRVKKI